MSFAQGIQAADIDAGTIAVAMNDGRVLILDPSPSPTLREVGTSGRRVESIALSKGTVATAGGWEPGPHLVGAVHGPLAGGPDGFVGTVAFANGGQSVAVGGSPRLEAKASSPDIDEGPALGPGEVTIWALAPTSPATRYPGDGSEVRALAGHPSQALFVAGFASGEVRLYPEGRLLAQLDAATEAVAFAPDGTTIAAVGGTRGLLIPVDGRPPQSLAGLPKRIRTVRLESTGELSIAAYAESVLFDPNLQAQIRVPAVDGYSPRMAARIGDSFVVVGSEGSVRALNLSGKQVQWSFDAFTAGPNPLLSAQ